MGQSIAISRIHFPVTTLGPGRRLGIWFQGCSIRCPGCISTDTWPHKTERMPVAEVLSAISAYAHAADGVTISGGEPFEQPEALGALLYGLSRILQPGTDVLVYSGLPFASLTPWLEQWQGLIDAVISEPFDATAPQTRPLMGSDNQQLHTLTDLGLKRFAEFQRPRDRRDDQLDVMVDEDGTAWMAGIPRRGDLERLQALLAAQGTASRTTEQAIR
jgi:anaerobic ribonucleoside-triphosphate reductase activating protein